MGKKEAASCWSLAVTFRGEGHRSRNKIETTGEAESKTLIKKSIVFARRNIAKGTKMLLGMWVLLERIWEQKGSTSRLILRRENAATAGKEKNASSSLFLELHD